jgi:hypothetical protein
MEIPEHLLKRARDARQAVEEQLRKSGRGDITKAHIDSSQSAVFPRSVLSDEELQRNQIAMWEILLPATGRDGKTISVEYHRGWVDRVKHIGEPLMVGSIKSGKGWFGKSEIFGTEVIPVRFLCSQSDIERILQVTLGRYPHLRGLVAACLSDRVVAEFRRVR